MTMDATRETTNDEITKYFGLPDLPGPVEAYMDEYSEGELAVLVVFQAQGEKICLDGEVLLADAQEYCSRDDTHGDGWFTGFYRR